MKNKLLDILYNPGSINTCQETEADYQNLSHQNTVDLNQVDYDLLQKLEGLVVADTEEQINHGMLSFYDQLFNGMSSGLRPTMLKEFNNFLNRTTKRYPSSRRLFNQSLKIVIELKNQIDKQNPSQAFIAKEEWVELERALFYLTQWEYKLGIKIEDMVLFEDEH
ncbi:MAG: hypothetical protein HQM16_05905 [Deltaproteobacteria bacterium]|nr:hypothetical protein [Deltaproteobacteria bacterium]